MNEKYPYPADLQSGTLESYWAELQGRPVAPVCPACGGCLSVLVKNADDTGGHTIVCPVCTGNNRSRWLAQNCGLEPRERQASLDGYRLSFPWPEKMSKAAATLNQQRKNVVDLIETAITTRYGIYTLWGDFGSGKSHALHTIVAECARAGTEAFYATTVGVLDHLRSLIATSRQAAHEAGPDQFWRRLLNVPALCLDDVDRFNATSWAASQFFMLVDTRYRRRRSHLTVFATNSDPENTKSEIGYLYSRMREFPIVRLQGDVRQVK